MAFVRGHLIEAIWFKCSVKFPFSSSSSLSWNWICDKTDENDHLQAFKYKFAIMHFIKVFVKTISNHISMSLAFPVSGDLLEWRHRKEKFLLLKYYHIKT